MSSSNLSIKKIQSPLLKAVMCIERQAFSHPWSAAMMRDSLDAAHTECYGIFAEDDQLLGYIILSVVLDELDVLSMAIDPAHQGRGYGKKLLDHVLQRAQRKKIAKIFLEARRANEKALSLYKNSGFQMTGTRKNYYASSEKDTREDAILMEWHQAS